ncbi:glycosyltransferase family 4 protein [Flavobacteriales bacterium]|nr:glycosyltransferase family 4 protein [Flavobacteriales bacterium]MDB4088996.1 glycosyltransferase family 4 protein [Flavobacteriales bacterium]
MKIAVNTRFLLPTKLEGFGWFTHEVVKRIVLQHPEHEFFFFFDRKYDDKFIYANNVKPIVINPPARHPFLYYLWFEFGVKKALKKHEIDVFLSPDGYLSLGSDVKQIPVIHDLSFVHFPKDIPFFNRKYVNYFFPKFAKKASKIVTVSEYSKNDISVNFEINKDKIIVAHNGIGDFFNPINEELKEATRSKFTGGKDYFLFVSALHPRKNIVNLFKSFDVFKNQTRSDVKLLMVGEKYWWNQEIKDCFDSLNSKKDIIFTGHVQSSELNDIYCSGLALTYVSYFEGFGIPLVEAMRCELPILASNATSLPEVGEEAAIYVNPFSVEDIKNGMVRLFKDESLRKELVENGKERAKLFNWQNTADKVWETIVEVFEND